MTTRTPPVTGYHLLGWDAARASTSGSRVPSGTNATSASSAGTRLCIHLWESNSAIKSSVIASLRESQLPSDGGCSPSTATLLLHRPQNLRRPCRQVDLDRLLAAFEGLLLHRIHRVGHDQAGTGEVLGVGVQEDLIIRGVGNGDA